MKKIKIHNKLLEFKRTDLQRTSREVRIAVFKWYYKSCSSILFVCLVHIKWMQINTQYGVENNCKYDPVNGNQSILHTEWK